MTPFDRITREPGKTGGRACIGGMRITVSNIVSQIAHGASIDELLIDYPDLEREDIKQARDRYRIIRAAPTDSGTGDDG